MTGTHLGDAVQPVAPIDANTPTVRQPRTTIQVADFVAASGPATGGGGA